jgi:nitroreductase
MSFLELAKKRYSVRNYLDKPIEKDKLLQVLEAGRMAPSAVNFQPWHFIIVEDPNIKDQLYTVYSRDWIKSAPAIIVACGDHQKAWRRADGKSFTDVDVAIAMDHMTLAAADLGLGTCWVCAFNSAQSHKILQLPSHMEIIGLLPIGYPADAADLERHGTKRKPLDEIVTWK